MKVKAFTARADEMSYFYSESARLGFDMAYCAEDLTMENVDELDGFEGISVVGTCDLSRPVLEAMKERGVRWAASRTIGYDNIDLTSAKELGIGVSHAAYSPYCVSNFSVMLILMLLRKSGCILSRTAAGDFSVDGMQGREMQNLTVGVIGTGRIGRKVIEHLRGFGCRIIANDIVPAADIDVEYVDLDTLFANSDFIVLQTVLNESTYHIIDTEAIAKMKKGACIVNVSRGAMVDTDALIEGLVSGKLGGAGLDCFEDEDRIIHIDHHCDVIPNEKMLLLRSMPNVIITPHIAFYTDESVRQMVRHSLECLDCFRRGEDTPLRLA